MSIGLDLSGNRFRSLRRQGNRLIARASRAVYAVVLDNPARRAQFAEQGVPFAEFGMNLILFGDSAEECSAQLRVSAIPLCVNGRLQMDDGVIRQVITALIEGLVPVPAQRPDDCCLTLPAGADRTNPDVINYLTRLLRSFGYEPRVTSAGLAVALSELSPAGVCGIGAYLGSSRCEFSVLRYGMEQVRFEVPRGIGAGLSSPEPPAVKTAAMEAALREIFATAAFELNRRPEWKGLAKPISLAISGDPENLAGRESMIADCIQHASWPFAIGPVRVAADPHWSVSRGCLIQAELEQLAALAQPAA